MIRKVHHVTRRCELGDFLAEGGLSRHPGATGSKSIKHSLQLLRSPRKHSNHTIQSISWVQPCWHIEQYSRGICTNPIAAAFLATKFEATRYNAMCLSCLPARHREIWGHTIANYMNFTPTAAERITERLLWSAFSLSVQGVEPDRPLPPIEGWRSIALCLKCKHTAGFALRAMRADKAGSAGGSS